MGSVVDGRRALQEEDWRREACRQPRHASAPGIDGVTAPASGAPRDETRRDRSARLRRGRDQAAPVERVWNEQAGGGPRPIGTPTFEDTIGQRAGAMRWASIEAPDLSAGSSGFRPGRSPQAARHAWRAPCRPAGRGGSVDAEVRGAVDRLDRTRGCEGLCPRVHAGRRWRRLGPRLRAGVREAGERRHPETGVVPGGVMSLGLAHVFLPHILEAWCARAVRPRLQGRCVLLRLADDVVIGGARAADARRIMVVRPQRVARWGGSLHPE